MWELDRSREMLERIFPLIFIFIFVKRLLVESIIAYITIICKYKVVT